MHLCACCREPLKLDASILERYPEWQTLNSRTSTANINIRKSSSKVIGSGKKLSTATLQQSDGGGSDYSQISSPIGGGGGGNGGGNLGHATAMMGNLFDTICEDAAAIDHPMCQECTDRLLDCMDQQLHQLEEDCKEYKNLSDRLDGMKDGGGQHQPGTSSSEQHFDLNSLKSELLKLQGEEAGLQAELARLEVEETELEKKLTREEEDLKKVTEDEEKLWKSHRDLNRQVHELAVEERSVRNQLRYANTQLDKLKTANVFNLTFHIWHSGHFGTINGFRLGRLPNEVVEWSEINAAWGQTVLLLYSLSRKISLKFKRYELVPFGSHSYIRCLDDGNKELPLFCSGGYKFFWDTKFDSAMVAYLECLQQFKEEIDKFGEIRLPYRMLKDKIEDNGNEYSVKIQFNSEERWTKAMKCMLTNLKWAKQHEAREGMKKELSNYEQWSRRIGYALTLLVLMDSIVPFAWNNYRRQNGISIDDNSDEGRIENKQRRRDRFAARLMNSLGKLAIEGKHFSAANEFGLENGFVDRSAKSDGLINNNGKKKIDGLGEAIGGQDNTFRQNLSVFILPDLRRTTNGNDQLAAMASNQELSLQDSDAIDFYWRQDIDAEKGLYPNLWSEDLQYERDVQLVTEKTLLQPTFATDQANRFMTNQQNDWLRDLLQNQQQKNQFFGIDSTPSSSTGGIGGGGTSGGGKTMGARGGWQSTEKAPFVFETSDTQQQTPQQEQQPDTSDAIAGALDDLDLDWLNATAAVDPMMNGAAEQGPSNSEYNFLNLGTVAATGNDLNTPPVSMDWESRMVEAAVQLNNAQQNENENANEDLFNEFFTSNDFDNLPTPDLLLAPNDVACIFGDRQVVQDIAEAQTTKEMLLHQSPIPTMLDMPSTSGSEVLAFVPSGGDENIYGQTESVDPFVQALTAYNDPYSSTASTSWQQSIPGWQPPTTTSTSSGQGVSVSPTYSGDHDYTYEPTATTFSSGDNAYNGQTPAANTVNDWLSYQLDELPVKTETDDGYYEEDESAVGVDRSEDDDEDEEDSDDSAGRVASERDEVRARQMNLPLTAAEIVVMSQPDYVALTRAKNRFTREQLELIKEIRRHGGNKEAARRSRQKKVQMSRRLEQEVGVLEMNRNTALAERRKLLREIELEERALEEAKRRNSRK